MFMIKRSFATSPKPKVTLAEDVLASITNNIYKPRKHPGVIKVNTVAVPDKFIKAAEVILADYPIKAFTGAAKTMNAYLKSRRPPMENKQLKNVAKKAQEEVLATIKNTDVSNNLDDERLQQSFKDKTTNVLRTRIYNWQPINYDLQNALVYLLARSAQDYAVLIRIMSEIAERDPNFKPRALFDFGSGIGMGTWAAMEFWKKHLFEYFNVDISRDMNDVAQNLLKGGSPTGKMPIKGVFYRQFLPASNNTYDLVICSHALLELSSTQLRMETILNLWNKTQKYLIVVEQGTKIGFDVINEIRDFILHLNEGNFGGHIFSPCPHEKMCPKFMSNPQAKCFFPVNFHPLPFFAEKVVQHENYSYVVFKRGERDSTSPAWPRLVEPTLVRSKHSICRMCTEEGKLQEIIFTDKKHGRPMFYCARKSRWGDSLPISIDNNGEVKDAVDQPSLIDNNSEGKDKVTQIDNVDNSVT